MLRSPLPGQPFFAGDNEDSTALYLTLLCTQFFLNHAPDRRTIALPPMDGERLLLWDIGAHVRANKVEHRPKRIDIHPREMPIRMMRKWASCSFASPFCFLEACGFIRAVTTLCKSTTRVATTGSCDSRAVDLRGHRLPTVVQSQ